MRYDVSYRIRFAQRKEILYMANQEKYTILYSRLSQKDERAGESNSI